MSVFFFVCVLCVRESSSRIHRNTDIASERERERVTNARINRRTVRPLPPLHERYTYMWCHNNHHLVITFDKWKLCAVRWPGMSCRILHYFVREFCVYIFIWYYPYNLEQKKKSRTKKKHTQKIEKRIPLRRYRLHGNSSSLTLPWCAAANTPQRTTYHVIHRFYIISGVVDLLRRSLCVCAYVVMTALRYICRVLSLRLTRYNWTSRYRECAKSEKWIDACVKRITRDIERERNSHSLRSHQLSLTLA